MRESKYLDEITGAGNWATNLKINTVHFPKQRVTSQRYEVDLDFKILAFLLFLLVCFLVEGESSPSRLQEDMIKSLSEDKLRTYGGHKRGSGRSSCADQVQPLPLEGDIQESCAYALPPPSQGLQTSPASFTFGIFRVYFFSLLGFPVQFIFYKSSRFFVEELGYSEQRGLLFSDTLPCSAP